MSTECDHLRSGVQQTSGSELPPGDRRTEVRRGTLQTVQVIPLDEHLQPCGNTCSGVMHSISQRGIGLVASVPQPIRFARIQFPVQDGSTLELVAEVTRCESLGSVCELGGMVRWISRTDPVRQSPAGDRVCVHEAP